MLPACNGFHLAAFWKYGVPSSPADTSLYDARAELAYRAIALQNGTRTDDSHACSRAEMPTAHGPCRCLRALGLRRPAAAVRRRGARRGYARCIGLHAGRSGAHSAGAIGAVPASLAAGKRACCEPTELRSGVGRTQTPTAQSARQQHGDQLGRLTAPLRSEPCA